MEFEKEKEDPKVYKDVGVQQELESLMGFTKGDDITNFYENLNMFIAEGKSQPLEWVNVVITDICSSKLIADYRDFKST